MENSLHMVEDIARHGPPDNYWCFMYERKVKYYKMQSTNSKAMCKTYADREAQLNFTTTYIEMHKTNEISPAKQWSIPLVSSSISEAFAIKEEIEKEALNTCDLSQGIMIGQGKVIQLNDQQKRDLSHWLHVDQSALLPSCLLYKKALKVLEHGTALVFRKGETAILLDAEVDDREWVVQIESFLLYGPLNGEYFGDSLYYVSKTAGETLDFDEWTGLPKLVQRNFRQLCIQPINLLSRKVILYNAGTYSLTIDPDKPVVSSCTVSVPHYPASGEVVELEDKRMFLIEDIDREEKKFKGYRLKRIGGTNGRWTKTSFTALTLPITLVAKNYKYKLNASCIYIEN